LAIASGAYAKNPARFRGRNEPNVDDPIGDAPDWLGADAKAAWHQYAATLPWLNQSHRAIVEIASVLKGRLAAGTLGVPGMQLLRVTLGQLGATPADVHKVNWAPTVADEVDRVAQYFL
jgi:hypothetical protein